MYDNSKAFIKYIISAQNLGLDGKALYSKANPTIVPHRLGAKLGAPFNALPDFPDAESWYLNVNLVGRSWTERSFEVARYPTEAEIAGQAKPKIELEETNIEQKFSEFAQGSSRSQ
ncbi:hypothetical protein EVG20_g9861 [Dentipellis fragilis]|uniref:Uncharacterized protein n=1 Tax=Dentipellis fragilis TaxID=205917 RepID=A0A4Y9XXB5_9AGAM|nr:hypothetical protein EVG20_g9861 [Dentipellis fragilis]